jgi:hypothetical protein
VFARSVVEVPLPASRVEDILTGLAHDGLGGIAEQADERGETLLGEAGIGQGGARFARSILLRVDPVVRIGATAIVPLHWEAAHGAGLFPSMDADLEISPLGDATHLAVSARYIPPMGRFGRLVDRALLHRVAEATIKDFLDRVAAAVVADDVARGRAR